MPNLKTIYGKIRAFLITSFVIFLILFIILISYKYKQEEQIIYSSQLQYVEDINSLSSLKSSVMKKLVYDYTYWDDLITAIEKRDTSWLTDNVDFSSDAYDLDYACV